MQLFKSRFRGKYLVMSESNWYDPWVAPGILLGIIATIGAVIGWVRSYISGQRSNKKEVVTLAEQTVEKAEAKGVKERADAKALYTEKTEAATSLKDSTEKEAIKVKKESQDFIADKFKFSDQEHAHQHSELKNELKALRVEIKQIAKDVEELKTNNKPLKY